MSSEELVIDIDEVEETVISMLGAKTSGDFGPIVLYPRIFRGMEDISSDFPREGEGLYNFSVVVPVYDDMKRVMSEVEKSLAKALVGVRLNAIINEGYIPHWVLVTNAGMCITDNGVVNVRGEDIDVPMYGDMKSLYVEATATASSGGTSVEEYDKYINKK